MDIETDMDNRMELATAISDQDIEDIVSALWDHIDCWISYGDEDEGPPVCEIPGYGNVSVREDGDGFMWKSRGRDTSAPICARDLFEDLTELADMKARL
jgi:hypothetical protein